VTTTTAPLAAAPAGAERGLVPTRALEGGGHPAVALGVLVASIGLALVGLALTAVVRPTWGVGQWYYAVDTVDAVVYGVVAWLVLGRLRHPVAWILAVTAVGGGLAAVGAQWTLLADRYDDVPSLLTLQAMQNTAWVPGTLALFLVLPWLIRAGRLEPVAAAGVAVGGAVVGWTLLGRLTDPFPWPDGPSYAPFAVHSEWWSGIVDGWWRWQATAIVVVGLLAAADVGRRWVGRPADERRGLGVLAVATAILALSFLPLALPESVSEDLPAALTPLVHLLSQALFPAAILGAVLRQRLWGLDLAVRRTLTWWLLSAGLVIAYVVLVTALGALLPGGSGIPQILATAVVAAGFQPARARIQRSVDTLVHGEAARPLQVVAEVGRSLGDSADPDELLTGLVEGLAESLRLGGCRIDAGTGQERRTVASTGSMDERAVAVPLIHQQRRLGELVVCPRPNERLDGRSLASLEALAPVVAATVALAAATEEVRASRARLAEARDEERRVLRRELHDGLGPALAGIGLGLQAGRNLLERDPAAAAELFDRLTGEIDARVEDVRGLARGLLPPALEELGLAPALLELSERHQAAGLSVTVDVADLSAVPPDVAAAVYGIVAEAVRNVQRHAGASSCAVVAEPGEGLVLRIVDDGVGIPPDAPAGVGMTSMRERAEGVGGTVRILPATGGGTEVRVHVPPAALAPRRRADG
jgi:signal transduction histidine kinase